MKYFLRSFSPFLLNQEGQLSVSGERMCTSTDFTACLICLTHNLNKLPNTINRKSPVSNLGMSGYVI